MDTISDSEDEVDIQKRDDAPPVDTAAAGSSGGKEEEGEREKDAEEEEACDFDEAGSASTALRSKRRDLPERGFDAMELLRHSLPMLEIQVGFDSSERTKITGWEISGRLAGTQGTFYVFQTILEQSSAYFEELLLIPPLIRNWQNKTNKLRPNVVELRDVDPVMFGFLVQFLWTGTITDRRFPDPSPSWNIGRPTHTMMEYTLKLWLLAENLEVPALMDYATWCFLKISEADENGHLLSVWWRSAIGVCNQDTLLWQLLVDIFTWDNDLFETLKKYNSWFAELPKETGLDTPWCEDSDTYPSDLTTRDWILSTEGDGIWQETLDSFTTDVLEERWEQKMLMETCSSVEEYWAECPLHDIFNYYETHLEDPYQPDDEFRRPWLHPSNPDASLGWLLVLHGKRLLKRSQTQYFADNLLKLSEELGEWKGIGVDDEPRPAPHKPEEPKPRMTHLQQSLAFIQERLERGQDALGWTDAEKAWITQESERRRMLMSVKARHKNAIVKIDEEINAAIAANQPNMGKIIRELEERCKSQEEYLETRIEELGGDVDKTPRKSCLDENGNWKGIPPPPLWKQRLDEYAKRPRSPPDPSRPKWKRRNLTMFEENLRRQHDKIMWLAINEPEDGWVDYYKEMYGYAPGEGDPRVRAPSLCKEAQKNRPLSPISKCLPPERKRPPPPSIGAKGKRNPDGTKKERGPAQLPPQKKKDNDGPANKQDKPGHLKEKGPAQPAPKKKKGKDGPTNMQDMPGHPRGAPNAKSPKLPSGPPQTAAPGGVSGNPYGEGTVKRATGSTPPTPIPPHPANAPLPSRNPANPWGNNAAAATAPLPQTAAAPSKMAVLSARGRGKPSGTGSGGPSTTPPVANQPASNLPPTTGSGNPSGAGRGRGGPSTTPPTAPQPAATPPVQYQFAMGSRPPWGHDFNGTGGGTPKGKSSPYYNPLSGRGPGTAPIAGRGRGTPSSTPPTAPPPATSVPPTPVSTNPSGVGKGNGTPSSTPRAAPPPASTPPSAPVQGTPPVAGLDKNTPSTPTTASQPTTPTATTAPRSPGNPWGANAAASVAVLSPPVPGFAALKQHATSAPSPPIPGMSNLSGIGRGRGAFPHPPPMPQPCATSTPPVPSMGNFAAVGRGRGGFPQPLPMPPQQPALGSRSPWGQDFTGTGAGRGIIGPSPSSTGPVAPQPAANPPVQYQFAMGSRPPWEHDFNRTGGGTPRGGPPLSYAPPIASQQAMTPQLAHGRGMPPVAGIGRGAPSTTAPAVQQPATASAPPARGGGGGNAAGAGRGRGAPANMAAPSAQQGGGEQGSEPNKSRQIARKGRFRKWQERKRESGGGSET